MSTWTKNLELLKPDVTDPVSPQPFNQNMDKLDAEITALKSDYVVGQGVQNGWIYRRWNSGIVEQWKSTSKYRVRGIGQVTQNIKLPVPMASSDYNVQLSLTGLTGGNVYYWTWIYLFSMNQKVDSFDIMTWNSADGQTVSIATHIYIIGRWK